MLTGIGVKQVGGVGVVLVRLRRAVPRWRQRHREVEHGRAATKRQRQHALTSGWPDTRLQTDVRARAEGAGALPGEKAGLTKPQRDQLSAARDQLGQIRLRLLGNETG